MSEHPEGYYAGRFPRPECPTCGLLIATVLRLNRCGLERALADDEPCAFPWPASLVSHAEDGERA